MSIRNQRLILRLVGAAMLVFGLGCLNYTKAGSLERHIAAAKAHNWPPPSRTIAYLGMLLAPLGAGLVGYSFGKQDRS